jgi:hypothetical protein
VASQGLYRPLWFQHQNEWFQATVFGITGFFTPQRIFYRPPAAAMVARVGHAVQGRCAPAVPVAFGNP